MEADRSGWNLAHFVALHSTQGKFPEIDVPEIHELLDVKNEAGASPRDFVRWLSGPAPQSVAAFGEEKSLLDPLEFEKLMGRSYWAYPKITPGALLRTYFSASDVDHPVYLGTLLDQTINQYVDSVFEGSAPQNIKIRKMEGSNVPAAMQGQWECLTSRDLKKGDIIPLYSGTIRHPSWDSSNKISNKAHFINTLFVDADCGGGNLVECINHGFPNCAAYAHCYRGLPLLVIIALEPMPINTALYLNYGTPHFKNLGIVPMTLNPQSMDQYLKTTQNLRKVPAIEIFPDGFGYFSVDRGQIVERKTNVQVGVSQALDAWAHKIRLIYLAGHQADEMKKKLDRPSLKLLMNSFEEG